jgi:hypothetical protein
MRQRVKRGYKVKHEKGQRTQYTETLEEVCDPQRIALLVYDDHYRFVATNLAFERGSCPARGTHARESVNDSDFFCCV